MTHHPYQRTKGMKRQASSETLARMEKANEEAIWSGRCPRCMEAMQGTLEQLRNHGCGTKARPDTEPTADDA